MDGGGCKQPQAMQERSGREARCTERACGGCALCGLKAMEGFGPAACALAALLLACIHTHPTVIQGAPTSGQPPCKHMRFDRSLTLLSMGSLCMWPGRAALVLPPAAHLLKQLAHRHCSYSYHPDGDEATTLIVVPKPVMATAQRLRLLWPHTRFPQLAADIIFPCAARETAGCGRQQAAVEMDCHSRVQ